MEFELRGLLANCVEKSYEGRVYGRYTLVTDTETLVGACSADLLPVLTERKGQDVKAVYQIYPDAKLKPSVRLVGIE